MTTVASRSRAGELFEAVLRRAPSQLKAGTKIRGRWRVVCRGADGKEKWVEEFENIVVNEGLDHLLDVTLSAGTPDTTWFIGLKGTGTPAAGDTLASHVTWSELTDYTGTRQAFVDGGVSGQSIDNVGNEATFPITGSMDVYGAFLCGSTSGTTELLYAAGDFATNRSVINGDTLEVTATFTTADDGV